MQVREQRAARDDELDTHQGQARHERPHPSSSLQKVGVRGTSSSATGRRTTMASTIRRSFAWSPIGTRTTTTRPARRFGPWTLERSRGCRSRYGVSVRRSTTTRRTARPSSASRAAGSRSTAQEHGWVAGTTRSARTSWTVGSATAARVPLIADRVHTPGGRQRPGRGNRPGAFPCENAPPRDRPCHRRREPGDPP